MTICGCCWDFAAVKLIKMDISNKLSSPELERFFTRWNRPGKINNPRSGRACKYWHIQARKEKLGKIKNGLGIAIFPGYCLKKKKKIYFYLASCLEELIFFSLEGFKCLKGCAAVSPRQHLSLRVSLLFQPLGPQWALVLHPCGIYRNTHDREE